MKAYCGFFCVTEVLAGCAAVYIGAWVNVAPDWLLGLAGRFRLVEQNRESNSVWDWPVRAQPSLFSCALRKFPELSSVPKDF